MVFSATLVERDLQKPYTNLLQDRHMVDVTAYTMCDAMLLLKSLKFM